MTNLFCWAMQRTSGVDFNPGAFVPRAEAFAAGVHGFDSATLLLTRDDATMRALYLTTGTGADSSRSAFELAQAVGAKASEVEPPADLHGRVGEPNVVGWLEFNDGSGVARNPQFNVDPTEASRLLANRIGDGSWVAVPMRRPVNKESRRHSRWLAHRLSTAVPNHHSMSPDALIVSVYAGGADKSEVVALLEAARAAMPGFDVGCRTRVATRATTLLPWIPAAVISTLVGALALFGTGSTTSGPIHTILSLLPTLALLTTLITGAIGIGRFTGLLPSSWKRTQALMTTLAFDQPARRFGPVKAPRKEINTATKQQAARDGDYPLSPSAFQVGPQVVIGIVAPHAGAESGEMTTQVRAVPPILLQRIGPMIGDTDRGPAYISAVDASGATAIVGKAGSGKSLLTRAFFGWSCLDRVRPSGLPGFPGARNTLIAFESKGDGVEGYQRWSDALGDIMVVIDLVDPSSYAIDLLAVPGTVQERANFFANALKYAFGEQAIQDRSFETLVALTPAALLVTPEIAQRVPDLSPHGSPIYYLHTLLGGRGDETGAALAKELHTLASRVGVDQSIDPAYREVVTGMAHLYGNVTPAQRRQFLEAPRNKIRQLIELEQWWTPSRPKVTWQQIIENHRAVVINTGTSVNGRLVEDELNAQMSALLMYSLRHAIQRSCAGWQDHGRSVSIFADELSLLAGSSEAVIAWLKDQGRAYGVRPFLATQRPEQLPQKVREVFMNFSTLISFTQEDPATAAEIAKSVGSGDDGEWTTADVLNLDTYTAIVRTHVDKKRYPAFTVRVRNFEADREVFPQTQGYGLTYATASQQAPSPHVAADGPTHPAMTPLVVLPPQSPAPSAPEAPGPDLLAW